MSPNVLNQLALLIKIQLLTTAPTTMATKEESCSEPGILAAVHRFTLDCLLKPTSGRVEEVLWVDILLEVIWLLDVCLDLESRGISMG